jgi:hypothetical protein
MRQGERCQVCNNSREHRKANPWSSIILIPQTSRELGFAQGCAAALEAYRKRNEARDALQAILDGLSDK